MLSFAINSFCPLNKAFKGEKQVREGFKTLGGRESVLCLTPTLPVALMVVEESVHHRDLHGKLVPFLSS